MIKLILLFYFLSFTLQIDHCIMHMDICEKCNSGSFLVQTSSLQYCSKIDHCVSISNDEQTCQKCMDAYEKNNSGQCIQKYELIDNCIEYDKNNVNYPTTTCDKCNRNYALTRDHTKCNYFQNCEELSQDTTKCQDCISPYRPNSEGKCDLSTCDSFRNNKCTECIDGFYLDSNGDCKQIPIKYCENGNEAKCFHCNDAAEMDNNGKCVLRNYINGCESYSTDRKTCTKCHQGFALNSDRTKCEIKYCQEIAQICLVCEDGYFTEGKTCKTFLSNFESKLNYSIILLMALFLLF